MQNKNKEIKQNIIFISEARGCSIAKMCICVYLVTISRPPIGQKGNVFTGLLRMTVCSHSQRTCANVQIILPPCRVCPRATFLGARAPLGIARRKKKDRNNGVWQSGISKSLAEYVQRRVCFVNVQSSLRLSSFLRLS